MKNLITSVCLYITVGISIGIFFFASSALADTATGESSDKVIFSVWNTGLTGTIPRALADDKEIQEKYGIKVSVIVTPNLPEVYLNLLTGRANALIGAPKSFASMRAKGQSIRIAGRVAPNTISIIGKAGESTADALRDSTLAAVVSSGGWVLLSSALERQYGLKAGDDYKVISVPNTLSGAAQVAAGTADYVMGWVPSVTQSLNKYPQLKIIYSTKDLGLTKSMQFVLGVSHRISKSTANKLLDAINAMAEKLSNNKELAGKYSHEQGYETNILYKVLKSGALPIKANSLDDEDRRQILSDLDLIYKDGGLSKKPTKAIFDLD